MLKSAAMVFVHGNTTLPRNTGSKSGGTVGSIVDSTLPSRLYVEPIFSCAWCASFCPTRYSDQYDECLLVADEACAVCLLASFWVPFLSPFFSILRGVRLRTVRLFGFYLPVLPLPAILTAPLSRLDWRFLEFAAVAVAVVRGLYQAQVCRLSDPQ